MFAAKGTRVLLNAKKDIMRCARVTYTQREGQRTKKNNNDTMAGEQQQLKGNCIINNDWIRNVCYGNEGGRSGSFSFFPVSPL